MKSPKVHFLALDFLRGVAAFGVIVFHLYGELGWFVRGYLAVDFFFMLSGFVIAHSYESKFLLGLSPRRFMAVRLVRLYPMIAVGALMGLAYIVLRDSLKPGDGTSWDLYLIALLANLFLIPILWSTRIGPGVFPLNEVHWSLFFELFANIVHALLARLLSNRVLIAIVASSFTALAISIGLGLGIDGGSRPDTFAMGFLRVLFPYFVGVLLYRIRSDGLWNLPLPRPLLLAAALVCSFLFGQMRGSAIPDLIFVSVLFPVIVHIGAMSKVRDSWVPWCSALGRLSYPLYALFNPILFICFGALKILRLNEALPYPVLGVLVALSGIAASWFILIFLDEPVRRRLGQTVLRRP